MAYDEGLTRRIRELLDKMNREQEIAVIMARPKKSDSHGNRGP